MVLLCFSGCNDTDFEKNESLYQQFVEGKIMAVDSDGTEKYIDEYVLGGNLGEDFTYTFFDMNDDNLPEICIKKHPEMYFFTIRENKVHHWYTETKSWSKLLNNGAFLYERLGGSPTHIDYIYYELDENGGVVFEISFSWWEVSTIENEKVYPDVYYINELKVSKEEYEEKTEQYLSIGDNEIIWCDSNGINLNQQQKNHAELLKVMNGETKFINENGEGIYFAEYKIPDVAETVSIVPAKYTFVDMDNDGYKELIVNCTTDYGLYIILHKDGDSIYGHSLGTRSFFDVKVNGTFRQSSSAFISSIAKITFEKTKMNIEILAEINDIDKEYYIKNESVTKQEAESYFNEHEEIESSIWTDVEIAD